MTYNFDPDRWYDNEYAALKARHRHRTIGDPAFSRALDDLEQRYEAMVDRLDGTYRLPGEAPFESQGSRKN